ncbi:Annexin [Fasciolopsis buskii]|uniref:Annexin n=1 Tax=Fasciolopsis buskii TaxID=27845 RepID=A0A8E0RYW8_9TREM|nr:Annexin [Fasciolopsis buski]
MAETDEYGIFSVLPCLLHSIITVGVIFRFGFERSWFHRLDGSGKLLTPTIKPTPGFSATADAERLHRAMKGAGTDEETIVNILARRTNHERQEICEAYQSLYQKSLRDALKDDCSGQFKTVLCELVNDTPYMLAKALYYAMKGLGTNDRVLIEVLTCLWNDEMRAVSEAYTKVLEKKGENTERTLRSDISKDTSGDFQYALLCLVDAQRDDIPPLQLKSVHDKGVETVINQELADADAKELLAAGASRVGTNEKRITRVICGRTPFQLCAANDAYSKLFGRSLLDDMTSELSGDYRKLILSVLRYAIDRPKLIAEWLHDTMHGLGTKDYALMRLIITRSEIDLGTVKQAYEESYGKSLADAVKGDTSGDYRKVLLAMVA